MKPACFRIPLLAAALLAAPAAFAEVLKPGTKAPEVKVAEWVKGKAFKNFQQSDYTVVEFWATWCGPCIEAIPHITELAKKHQGKVSFYGVSVWEEGDDVADQVKKFVRERGDEMNYNVGRDTADSHMANSWMKAAKQGGIPASFLVDKTGTLLWVGHPMELEKTLDEVLAGKFDLAASIKKFDDEAARAELYDAAVAKVKEATALYESGKKKEGLAKLEEIATNNDPELINYKKFSRMQIIFDDLPALTAYVDQLIAEGGENNANVLTQLSYFVQGDATDEHKALARKALDASIKMDEKNPLIYLMAASGWMMLGDKKKGLEVLDAGEKLIPGSKWADNKNIKEGFAQVRKELTG